MKTAYEDKINTISVWYDNLMLKYRLLLTINGSENLQNLMLNSRVVNINTRKNIPYAVILTNDFFGLIHIQFYSGENAFNLIKIEPFMDFSLTHDTYFSVCNRQTNHPTNSYANTWFELSDIYVLRQVFDCDFKSDFESVLILIREAYAAQKSLIYTKIRNSIQSGIQKVVETNDEVPLFVLMDGLSFSSSKDLYIKFKEELEGYFLDEYSESVTKSKRFKETFDELIKQKHARQSQEGRNSQLAERASDEVTIRLI